MRVVLIRMLIRIVRWVVIHLILRPVIERYIEVPLYELLVAGSEGDSPGEDVELGDGEASVEAWGDPEGVGDNLV